MMDFLLDPSSINNESTPSLRAKINGLYLCDEQDYVQDLLDTFPESGNEQFNKTVENLVEIIRKQHSQSVLHQLLQEYELSTEEGITLLCLAEALVRVPDQATANQLLVDKISDRGWQHHLNKSESFWVNAASWGLALSGRMLKPKHNNPVEAINGLVSKLTLSITRDAVNRAIRVLSEQFIFAEDIEDAVDKSNKLEPDNTACSFDMLGEQAITEQDAQSYFHAYAHAIETVAVGNQKKQHLHDNISIKLSALHPRYEPNQQHTVVPILMERVLKLASLAKEHDVPITIDAEEQYRLDMMLQVFESVFSHQSMANWEHLGIAVQAYGKRALAIIHWLHALAQKEQKRIPLRLVKGAYWDFEIKWAQQNGLSDYPVLTQKASTDLNYLNCARFLLCQQEVWLQPRFASHNAWTVQYLLEMNSQVPFELQRLQGMGTALFNELRKTQDIPFRIYAPVGKHRDVLPYMVRRLIENGANTSFVFQVQDPYVPMHHLLQHPADFLTQSSIANPNIPSPREIFVDYPNSEGAELGNDQVYYDTMDLVLPFHEEFYDAPCMIAGKDIETKEGHAVSSPVDKQTLGRAHYCDQDILDRCIDFLKNNAIPDEPVELVCSKLERFADLLVKNQHELMYLCMEEAGKTLQNAHDEVREAVDLVRYYARQAQKNFSDPSILDSVTGEENLLTYDPRGTVLCISPWNFPLATFIGQVSAALGCGNRIIAKPARQTSIIAHRVLELLLEADIHPEKLFFLPGKGSDIAHGLIRAKQINMVCFTGSIAAAKQIQSWLIEYGHGFTPFVAETGGQNIMVADSTALIEQLVQDVVHSAFDSSGQRCSALRVLFIQEDIKETFYRQLQGRMALLNIDSPFLRNTDMGPLIDLDAHQRLTTHIAWLQKNAKHIATAPLNRKLPSDNYLAPSAWEIEKLTDLTEEHFGPILHVISFKPDELENIIHQVNAMDYGLTFGIHSRNQRWINYISHRVGVGNVYINREMIGAKVGAQPFGGHGMSGTGPKAGGPNYVHAFVKEKTLTSNITALGGNQDLLS